MGMHVCSGKGGGPCVVPVVSPKAAASQEEDLGPACSSFGAVPHPTPLHPKPPQMQPCAQPPNPCVTEIHNSDSYSFNINQALR